MERFEHPAVLPERPWWCASCHGPPMQESDRMQGFCTPCSDRDREQRQRAAKKGKGER